MGIGTPRKGFNVIAYNDQKRKRLEREATQMTKPEFEPDEWLYVEAATADDARKFFGAPPYWRVEFDRLTTDRPGKVWRVQSKGLTIK
jgi:DNA-dependent RNA polymerase auxiliary subunit epsilon